MDNMFPGLNGFGTARRDEKWFGGWCDLYQRFGGTSKLTAAKVITSRMKLDGIPEGTSNYICFQTSDIRRTKFQNLTISRLVFWLSLPKPLKSVLKCDTKNSCCQNIFIDIFSSTLLGHFGSQIFQTHRLASTYSWYSLTWWNVHLF